MKDGMPPRFKPWMPPKAISSAAMQNRGRHRTSPRKRGYDAIWDKASLSFRRANPVCLFCRQERSEELWEATEVTDHVLPAHEFPALRLKRANWIPLCSFHHNTTKQRLEDYARKHNCLALLELWVWEPMKRPSHLRPISLNPGWSPPAGRVALAPKG